MNSQRVSDFMSRDAREKKSRRQKFTSIAAYPQNSVIEVAKIMTDIRIDRLPVLLSPWNKKLVGFIELNNIRFFLQD